MNQNDLIARFLAGEASPEEAMKLEDWKNISIENKAYYDALEQIYCNNKSVKPQSTWSDFEKRLSKPRKGKILPLFTQWNRVAAVFMGVILVSSVLLFTFNSMKETSLKSDRFAKNFKLEDGSFVHLAKESTLELEPGFGTDQRYLKLTGSAYFTVKHDSEKPFRIQMNDLFIEDLGTKFDIQTGKDTIFIRVDEGSVKIFNAKGMNLVLNPGDKAFYVISDGTFRVTVESDYFEKIAPVKFIFENQRLETVVNTLNESFACAIELENQSLASCRITCTFSDESLDVILDVITETLDLTREKKGDVIRLKGKGC